MPHPSHIPGRLRVLSIILCCCILLLTGCDTTGESEDTQQKPEMTHSGEQLTILVPWSHVGAAEKLAELFYEQTGTVIRIIKVEYHDLLESSLEDFNAPTPQADVYQLWYAHLGRLAEEGVIVDLDNFYDEYRDTLNIPDLIPHFFNQYTLYKDKRWAVPWDGDLHVLFYRKSLFEKHNLKPPETWDEYLEITRYITEHESENTVYGAAIMGYPTPVLIIGSYLNRLGGYGGALINDDNLPQAYSKEGVAALQSMVEHARYALPTPLETDFAVARDAFIQGKVGMVEQWTDIGIMAEDPRQSLIRGDWGVVPIPTAEGVHGTGVTPLNAGWSLALSAKSPKRELAEQFLAFSIREDIHLQLNLIPGGGGLDPIRKSTIFNKDFQAFAPQVSKVEEQLLTGNFVAFSNHPTTPDLLNDLTNAIVAALEETLSPEEALRECQEKWDAKLKESR